MTCDSELRLRGGQTILSVRPCHRGQTGLSVLHKIRAKKLVIPRLQKVLGRAHHRSRNTSDAWMRLRLECSRERAAVRVALASSGVLCSPTKAAVAMAAAAG